MKLSTHSITLRGERVTLRPLTEDDWPLLLRWNSDPEVLYYSEGDNVSSYSLEEVQEIYRTTSQTALCFIIEYQGRPIGEGWLQRMNLERLVWEYPGDDLRRIDLMIGEKELWGQGLGSEAIRLLKELAFQQESADFVFALVEDTNPRSQRAFEKNGFHLAARHPNPPGSKARFTLDLLAKNPHPGFHSYAVQVFFDSQTEAAIRTAWRELSERGVAPYLHQSTNRPHFTLSIYSALDLPKARQRLSELAAAQAQLPISFPFHGIFPGLNPVVFLAPRVTEGLLALQSTLCKMLDGLGTLPEFDYYRPECWVPHCALAMEFDGTRLMEAVEIARHLPLPLDGTIREIGLTEMRPVRHLGTWSLAAA